MAAKRYKSLTGTQYTFPVSVGGKVIWVSFKGPQDDFVTSDEALQKAIEKHPRFTGGQIGVAGQSVNKATPVVKIPAKKGSKAPIMESAEPDAAGGNPEIIPGETSGDETGGESVEYPDVADINAAVAVLRGEPYKVHHLSLRTPAAVREQAALNKVAFPNWPAE